MATSNSSDEPTDRLEDRLARLFNELPPTARRSNLLRLMEQLSPWEKWHLKEELHRPLHMFPLAGLVNLPLELVVMIAGYVDLTSYTRFLLVSKAWNTVWSHPSVVRVLFRRFFPGHDPGDATDLTCFRKLGRKYLRRERMKPLSDVWREQRYSDEIFFTLDPEFHLDGRHPLIDVGMDFHHNGPYPTSGRIWYGHGMLVWEAEIGVFVVDNFYTLRRRVVQFTGAVAHGGLRTREVIVSKSIIIFDSPIRLAIYHLKTGLWGRVTLPGPMAACVAHGELFAVLLESSEMILWRFDGRQVSTLLEKDVRPLTEGEGYDESKMDLVVTFGPEPTKSLFVVALQFPLDWVPETRARVKLDDYGRSWPPISDPPRCPTRLAVFEIEISTPHLSRIIQQVNVATLLQTQVGAAATGLNWTMLPCKACRAKLVCNHHIEFHSVSLSCGNIHRIMTLGARTIEGTTARDTAAAAADFGEWYVSVMLNTCTGKFDFRTHQLDMRPSPSVPSRSGEHYLMQPWHEDMRSSGGLSSPLAALDEDWSFVRFDRMKQLRWTSGVIPPLRRSRVFGDDDFLCLTVDGRGARVITFCEEAKSRILRS